MDGIAGLDFNNFEFGDGPILSLRIDVSLFFWDFGLGKVYKSIMKMVIRMYHIGIRIVG